MSAKNGLRTSETSRPSTWVRVRSERAGLRVGPVAEGGGRLGDAGAGVWRGRRVAGQHPRGGAERYPGARGDVADRDAVCGHVPPLVRGNVSMERFPRVNWVTPSLSSELAPSGRHTPVMQFADGRTWFVLCRDDVENLAHERRCCLRRLASDRRSPTRTAPNRCRCTGTTNPSPTFAPDVQRHAQVFGPIDVLGLVHHTLRRARLRRGLAAGNRDRPEPERARAVSSTAGTTTAGNPAVTFRSTAVPIGSGGLVNTFAIGLAKARRRGSFSGERHPHVPGPAAPATDQALTWRAADRAALLRPAPS